MKRFAYPLFTCALSITAACGGHEDGHGGHEGTPAADACEHMVEGPSQAVTAIADRMADAPDVGEHHTRFDIDLVADAAGMYVGYVHLVNQESAITDLFLDADVPVRVWNTFGDELEAHHAQTSIAECTEVSVGLGYSLGVGTWVVGFGPTTEQSVSVVLVPEGEGEH